MHYTTAKTHANQQQSYSLDDTLSAIQTIPGLTSLTSANDSEFTSYVAKPLTQSIHDSLYTNTKNNNYSSATHNNWADYLLRNEKPLLGGFTRAPSSNPFDEESVLLRAYDKGYKLPSPSQSVFK